VEENESEVGQSMQSPASRRLFFIRGRFFVRIQPMQNKPAYTALLFLLLLLFLASCSLSTPEPTALPTFTQPPPPTFISFPTDTPVPTPTVNLIPARAKYQINAVIDYDAHIVTVDESIEYPNHTGEKLSTLTLAVEPNLWTGSFTLNGISIDGKPVTTYVLEGQRLDIPLSSFILPETMFTLNIQYTLDLPFAEQEDPNIARPRIYGHTKRQLNLVNWYPFIVPYINDEWVLHEPWFYGEHLVYDSADYVVDVKFTDPANAPIVAASGEPFAAGDSTRYVINSARTFALAASREFQVASTQVGDVTVSSYYFPLYKIGGQDALRATAEALSIYSQRYGPYTHKTLSLVMGDFNDGMEYSAFYYLPAGFYNLYNEKPGTHLISIAVHETAHQWWFEQVGNDQALQPWLDETLCTYSEVVYYEKYYPNVLDQWWWPIRIEIYNPHGFVDIPIYDGQGFQPYTNSAYFQGAHFLDKLRARIGDDAFFAFLQDYAKQNQNKIATANDFFEILSRHTKTDYSDLVIQYFRNIYK
jgi:aminopeptidase N